MRWIALVVLVSTGCDHLFDIHSIDIPRDDAQPTDVVAQTDGPVPGGGCSAMTMLADDFASDDLQAMWPATSALGANQIAVNAGKLEIRNFSAGSYATLDAGHFYDLRGTWFAASITDDGAVDENDFIQLELVSATGHDLKITRDNQNVHVLETAPSQGPNELAMFAYQAGAMAYFRVAELGNTMTVDTSPDGLAYTMQAVVPDPVNWAFARPSIQTHRGASSPQYVAYVDDVDGGKPKGGACPIAQLRDDFTGPGLSSQWASSEAYGGTLTVHDGIADLASDGAGTIALASSTVYDLTGSALFLEVPAILASAATNTVELRITTGAGDTISWLEGKGMLSNQGTIDGGAGTSTVQTYNPATMRWWKISFDPLGWATSSDGMTWQLSPGTPPPLREIERCDIRFIVTSNSGVAGDTRVDNVNVPP